MPETIKMIGLCYQTNNVSNVLRTDECLIMDVQLVMFGDVWGCLGMLRELFPELFETNVKYN